MNTIEAVQLNHPNRRRLKAFLQALFIVALTLLFIELLVRIADPWGLSYFDDLATMMNDHIRYEEERGFVMRDGSYQYSHWQAVISEGRREIPNTNPAAACSIALIGDSVTFSYGVNDAETWANQIAARYPDVHFINWGVTNYNSTNVVQSWQANPDADGYLYLFSQNDINPAVNLSKVGAANPATHMPMIIRYVNFALNRYVVPNFIEQEGGEQLTLIPGDETDLGDPAPQSPEEARLFAELDTLAADARVQMVGFSGSLLTDRLAALGYDLWITDYPAQRISFVDRHLTAEGNAELADNVLPAVELLVNRVC